MCIYMIMYIIIIIIILIAFDNKLDKIYGNNYHEDF